MGGRTEAEMMTLLRTRYTEKAGNGDAFAFIPQVRDAAGFDSCRTLDAICMSLWPSRGLVIDGFEVKCSRKDWLREKRDPAKAEGFCDRVDRFWLVIADPAILRDGELPLTWGLLVPQGGRLVQKVQAPLLREADGTRGKASLPPGLKRSFLAALLRSACAVGGVTPAEVSEAQERGYEQGQALRTGELEREKAKLKEIRAAVREFEKASGLSISGWAGREDAATVGAAVRTVLSGGSQVQNIVDRLDRHARAARDLADHAEKLMAELKP